MQRLKPPSSFNQSNIYSTNFPGKARLSGTTAESVFNSKIDEAVPQHQQAIGHAGVYGGKVKSRTRVFRCFLKLATEMAEQTDSGRLFQRDGTQERKVLAPVLVLTLGTDRQFLCLIEVNGMGVMQQAWSEYKQAVFHGMFCRSTNWKHLVL